MLINHKPNCQCQACKAKRGELSGENNPMYGKKGKLCPSYKHGKTLKQYYCKDCLKKGIKTKISYQSGFYGDGRCNHCNQLGRKHPKAVKKLKELWKTKEYRDRVIPKIGHRKWTEEAKRKLSLANGGTGIPYENTLYGSKFTSVLKESIRKRDNYECQNCGMTEEEHLIVIGRVLTIHHIDYNKKNCKDTNLITLCLACNTRANYNKDYWVEYYNKKIKEKTKVS